MNTDSRRQHFPSESLYKSIFSWLLLFLSLLPMLYGVRIHSSSQIEASTSHQQHIERLEEDSLRALLPAHEIGCLLLTKLPWSANAPSLALPNYVEDTAIREAILARSVLWCVDPQTKQPYYRASNTLSVYFIPPDPPHSLAAMQTKALSQPEGTLLTARILLGLWISRHDDPHLSLNGNVVIHPDEILAWRGVQKHHRLAYQGFRKHFSDGYPWKQKQQISQDLALLSHYHLRGQHFIVSQGKVQSIAIDAPYLSLTPIEKQGKIAGYLLRPGSWISSYEAYHTNFLASMNRQIFQLNPRNDYLALRLAFYLVEHWRRHAQTGDYQKPLCMAHLLSASMIPIDKANLTSRFAPRIEAALQKLYTAALLGEPPLNLSVIDTTKAQWGKDWLASFWRLVPRSEFIHQKRG